MFIVNTVLYWRKGHKTEITPEVRYERYEEAVGNLKFMIDDHINGCLNKGEEFSYNMINNFNDIPRIYKTGSKPIMAMILKFADGFITGVISEEKEKT